MRANSFIKLRKLTVRSDEPVEDILRRVAEQLRGFAADATIQVRVIGKAKRAYWIQINTEGAHVRPEPVADPALAVSIGAAAFHRIAEGSYSPVQAYLDGKLHLRGNVELGRRALVHLAGSGTDAEGCLSVETHWQPPTVKGKALGELTCIGRNFTPFGRYEVHFNFLQVDPPPPAVGVADPSGQFTFTTTLECDPNGVDIKADDLESGEVVEFNFPIPCLV